MTPPPSRPRSRLALPGPVRLGLAAAALLAAAASAGPAWALGAVNMNPGGNPVITYSSHQQLLFLPETTVTQQVNNYATQIVGRLASGPALFNLTVADAYGSAGVQAALASAQAVLLAAAGPGTAIAVPALLSSVSNTITANSSLYSLDPSYSDAYTFDPSSGTGTGQYHSIAQTQTFAPATLQVASAIAPSTSAYPGLYDLCGAGSPESFSTTTAANGLAAVLPSTTKPTCSAFDGGTLALLPGQLNINSDNTFTYPIDTLTTVNNTTTLTQTYELVGIPAAAPTGVPEPAGWPVFAAGLAAMGLVVRHQARA